jgi:hypothetical protein
MKENEKNLYELVKEAQCGNQEAMIAIIEKFYPLINKMSRRVEVQERDDFEQEILEKITRAILTYDMNTPIDLTYFKQSIRFFVNKSKKQNTSQEGGYNVTNSQSSEFHSGDAFPLHLLGIPQEDAIGRLICVVSLNCGHCLSLLNQLHKIRNTKEIKFLLVTNGTEEENASVKEQFGYPFTLISFAGRSFSEIGVSGTPQAYLIDRYGVVRGRKLIRKVEDINEWMEEVCNGNSGKMS